MLIYINSYIIVQPFRSIVGHVVSYNFAATMHLLVIALTILDYICIQYSMV